MANFKITVRHMRTDGFYYLTLCSDFRQLEKSHMMENVIYNELRVRGFNVDVGVVPVVIRDKNGVQKRVSYEIDFV